MVDFHKPSRVVFADLDFIAKHCEMCQMLQTLQTGCFVSLSLHKSVDHSVYKLYISSAMRNTSDVQTNFDNNTKLLNGKWIRRSSMSRRKCLFDGYEKVHQI